MLIRLSEKLRGSEEREAIVQTALATCLEMFSADQGYLMVPSEDGEALEVIAQLGNGPIAHAQRLGYNDSISGHVFRTGISYCSPNLLIDTLGYRPNLQHWVDIGITFMSAIYAPLRAGDQITGILSLANMETRRMFSQADLRLLDAIAEITGGALHRASILEGLEQRVTDRTADLAQANLRLLELDQLKSDFVTNVSHELRTPLTNIKLHLELLKRGRPERREHYLQVVRSEAEQLHALIESILQLSALDAWDNPTEKFTIVSLNELTEAIFDRFQEQARAAKLEFVYQPGSLPLFIQGNLEYLQQLVVNLVTNAIHYTPAGGRVELALETNRHQEAGIVVRDTGIGIPADEIHSIFERFYRGKRVREAQISGTGLGLSIVRDVAQAHGGRVEVESVPDVGTTISVWFPRAKMESAKE
jgi:signal transduction histidine kinase